jgi:hypothetical protein
MSGCGFRSGPLPDPLRRKTASLRYFVGLPFAVPRAFSRPPTLLGRSGTAKVVGEGFGLRLGGGARETRRPGRVSGPAAHDVSGVARDLRGGLQPLAVGEAENPRHPAGYLVGIVEANRAPADHAILRTGDPAQDWASRLPNGPVSPKRRRMGGSSRLGCAGGTAGA